MKILLATQNKTHRVLVKTMQFLIEKIFNEQENR